MQIAGSSGAERRGRTRHPRRIFQAGLRTPRRRMDSEKMTMPEEIFDVVDETGERAGTAPRSRCHGDPRLIHPVVHVMIFDGSGRVLLQKRADTKDIQPGKWDTSVGGHMKAGEDPVAAAFREILEEVGARPEEIEFAYSYVWRSPVETEFVRTYVARSEGPFAFDPEEISEGRFWTMEEIEAELGKGIVTPNFEVEFQMMRRWLAAGNEAGESATVFRRPRG
jgi:isopentenyldiphosphate isomerase